MVFYFSIKKIENYTKLAYFITAYEIIIIVLFLMTFQAYENPNYLIQAFGVMIILLAIFLVPNKWINMVISAILIMITFNLMAYINIKNIKLSEFLAGLVYIFLVTILSGLSSFRNNYLQRKKYLISKELLRLSETDSLTNIYNRGKFDEELKFWFDYSKRYDAPLSLIIFDIDDYKKVNDTYGHLVGDKIIVELVQVVKDALRKTDIFARFGGDEFVLLLTNTNNKQAVDLTERIRLLVSAQTHETVERVTCSYGLATLMEDDELETFLGRADEMLYISKVTGKNRVVSKMVAYKVPRVVTIE